MHASFREGAAKHVEELRIALQQQRDQNDRLECQKQLLLKQVSLASFFQTLLGGEEKGEICSQRSLALPLSAEVLDFSLARINLLISICSYKKPPKTLPCYYANLCIF